MKKLTISYNNGGRNVSMEPFINLLPYMTKIERVYELLDEWTGGIEISTDGPHWHGETDWELEKRRFEEHTGPIGVHLPIFELNLASVQYPEHAEYSFEMYTAFLEWSSTFASHAVLHTHLYSTPLFQRIEAQNRSKEYLNRLGSIAEKAGIDLLVENVGFHGGMLFNEQEFVQLFEEIPTIKALIDVGHAHINNWDTPKVIEALGNKLKALHLHDNDRTDDSHLPIGEGTIQWDPIWESLKKANHHYLAILEYREGTEAEKLLNDVQMVTDLLSKETV